MILKRIGLIGIVFISAVCFSFSCGSLVFATECPPAYPFLCEDVGFCCKGYVRDFPFGCIIAPIFDNVCTPAECTSEELYGEHSEETELLRDFRDNVLAQTLDGQQIIKLYYQLSPVVVEAMQADEEFKEDVKEMIDVILPLVKGAME